MSEHQADGVMRLVGTLGIEEAGATMSALLAAVEAGKPITIDLSSVECIELPGFQVLFAAYAYAQEKRVALGFRGNLCDDLAEKLKAIGVCSRDDAPYRRAEDLDSAFREFTLGGADAR
jgi:anti-anti-sigma regulatory factor